MCLLIMRYIHNAAGVAVYPVCLELYSLCFRKSPRSPAALTLRVFCRKLAVSVNLVAFIFACVCEKENVNHNSVFKY